MDARHQDHHLDTLGRLWPVVAGAAARAMLLTWLLVLALGSGVVAQAPSPEATPWYAPDDLASAIPREVGDVDLYVRVGPPNPEQLGDPEDQAVWRGFLEERGREPADMVAAYGAATDSDAEPSLALWAIRVAGVPAEELLEPTLVTSDIDLSAIPPGGHADWLDIDGRSVLVLTADGTDAWRAYYPRGEVLFVAHQYDQLAVEDVIAALGTAAVAQSPPPEPSPTFVGWVELPGHGLAVDIPEGWVGLDPRGDLDGQLADIEDRLEETRAADLAEELRRLWDRSQREEVPIILVGLDATQVCVIQPAAQVAPDQVIPSEMLGRLVRMLHGQLLADEGRTDIGELVTVPLAMGEAWVVTSTERSTGQAETSYWLEHGDGVLWVLCQGDTRPQDDWLSIAEAIEPLPSPTAPAPTDG